MTTAPEYDPDADGPLMDPTDPTGRREICRNRDEIDFMLWCAELHPLLPKILYLRKQGDTFRQIAGRVGIGKTRVGELIAWTTKHKTGHANKVRPVGYYKKCVLRRKGEGRRRSKRKTKSFFEARWERLSTGEKE